MKMLKIENEYPKEAAELGIALGTILGLAGKALGDGWQAGQDLSTIFGGSLASLMVAMEGLQKIAQEGKEMPGRTAAAIVNPVLVSSDSLIDAFRK